MATDADTFTRERPDIDEADAIGAAQTKRIVQSFNAHPISNADGSYDAIAIKWKLADGSTESLLLGRYAGTVLGMMLSQLQASRWTEIVTLSPDATRQ